MKKLTLEERKTRIIARGGTKRPQPHYCWRR